MNECKITRGKFGRMVESTNGRGRGHVYIRESPLATVKICECHCHQSLIMTEYVTLAWAMSFLSNSNSIPVQSPVATFSRDINSSSSFVKCLLDDFIETSFDGTAKISEGELSSLWTLETEVSMAVVSSLISLYTNECYSSVVLDSEHTFKLLRRIPTNIHAIFDIMSESSPREEIVEQKRVGFGLFSLASAMNHSCQPNASLRYHFIRGHKDLDVVLEVIALKSIGSASEVNVSYGPMVGSHQYNARQEFLRHHFLFECRCDACAHDLSQQSLNSNKNINNDIAKSLGRLSTWNDGVRKINEVVTMLLTDQSNDLSGIENYMITSLLPCRNDLINLASELFGNFEFIDDLKRNIKDKYSSTSFEHGLYREFAALMSTVLDLEARLLAHLGKFTESARQVNRAIGLMISAGLYAADDVAIGREEVKLAQLFINSGNTLHADKVARRALGILRLVVSEMDPDYIESACIVRTLLGHKEMQR